MQINTIVMSGFAAADTTTTQVNTAIKASFILVQLKKTTRKGQPYTQRNSIQVECWGKTADVAAQYIGKDKRVVVHGELETQSWKDGNGEWVNKIVLKASNIDLIGAKRLPEQK